MIFSSYPPMELNNPTFVDFIKLEYFKRIIVGEMTYFSGSFEAYRCCFFVLRSELKMHLPVSCSERCAAL